jgi:hypothetical protein
VEIPPEQRTPRRFTDLLDHVISEVETLKTFVGEWQIHQRATPGQLELLRDNTDSARRLLGELKDLLSG